MARIQIALSERARLRREQVVGVDAAVFDAVRRQALDTPALGQAVAERDALVEFARQAFGAGRLGHRQLVLDAVVHGLEGRRHLEDDALALRAPRRAAW